MGLLLSLPQVPQERELSRADLAFMADWGKRLGYFEPHVCATHESGHAYGYEKRDVTTYWTIDGATVLLDGKEIDSGRLFSHAHYGPGGGPLEYENKSILKTVRRQYLDFYERCEEADKTGAPRPDRPQKIVTQTTYCGN
jgi:hypothetical protein